MEKKLRKERELEVQCYRTVRSVQSGDGEVRIEDAGVTVRGCREEEKQSITQCRPQNPPTTRPWFPKTYQTWATIQ